MTDLANDIFDCCEEVPGGYLIGRTDLGESNLTKIISYVDKEAIVMREAYCIFADHLIEEILDERQFEREMREISELINELSLIPDHCHT